MEPAKCFILPTPWGHLDPKASEWGFGRKLLSPAQSTEIDAGVPVYLAVPAGETVRVTGYKMGTHQLSNTYQLGGTSYVIWLLSVGVKPTEHELEIEISGCYAGTIRMNGFISRPAFSAGEESTSTPTKRAEELDIFLLSIIDLIQMTNDPQYEKLQIVWNRLFEAWVNRDAESTIPPMALIVRHAHKLQSLIKELNEKPRHILRRKRELTPVDRVQQLDISCVRWLSRQPGRDIYQRAGPRQRILSVQRHESFDTLENRVFADVAKRSLRAAAAYTLRYKGLKGSERWNLVSIYGRRCRHVSLNLCTVGVSSIHPPVVPNFVLLQDFRYRRIWRAYIELLRQSEEEDECWRWQHRLWFDYVRLLTHLSLTAHKNFQTVAEAPLRVNDEQHRGAWIKMDSQSGTWLALPETADESVVSLIWSMTSSHPKIHPWIGALGCQAVIHVQRLTDQREGYIALWGYHSFAGAAPDLKALGQSANNAIENCKNNARLAYDEEIDLRGLIIASDFQKNSRVAANRTSTGEVIIQRMGISHTARVKMIDGISNSIISHIKAIFSN